MNSAGSNVAVGVDEILAIVRPMVAKRLRCQEDKVTLEAHLRKDLDADSIDLVELVMALENHFDIEFTDDAVEAVQTVGDAVTYLQSVLSKQ